ncbi:esterase [Lederbergia lenta]|uniref:Protein, esterase YitV n=1 Tax=Lederbergia lenta TaxID=1467 RepID=A0A2X4WMG3_LEDLE|nr:esterase [Lederbergia lenta]MEC2323969.1 esterase [Lederbergia lenta]SQI60888.1 protein, esterase YitV [Lederbergia lenta]
MIEIHKENISDIPLLHVVETGKYNEMLPLVFFVHGFTSAKEHNLHFAYLLAERGFRVILPETKLHGERNTGIPFEKVSYKFWDIVIQTIGELATIKEEYATRRMVDEERIGLVGTSMGGIITLGALTQYKWIKAAVSLMGSPNYEQLSRSQIAQLKEANINIPFSDEQLEEKFSMLKPFDLSKQAELIDGRPILFWHGMKDPVVPFKPTYEFYERIKKGNADTFKFIVDEKAGHKVSREALLETVAWFVEHL